MFLSKVIIYLVSVKLISVFLIRKYFNDLYNQTIVVFKAYKKPVNKGLGFHKHFDFDLMYVTIN